MGTVRSLEKKVCWVKKLIHALIKCCSMLGPEVTEKKTAWVFTESSSETRERTMRLSNETAWVLREKGRPGKRRQALGIGRIWKGCKEPSRWKREVHRTEHSRGPPALEISSRSVSGLGGRSGGTVAGESGSETSSHDPSEGQGRPRT